MSRPLMSGYIVVYFEVYERVAKGCVAGWPGLVSVMKGEIGAGCGASSGIAADSCGNFCSRVSECCLLGCQRFELCYHSLRPCLPVV